MRPAIMHALSNHVRPGAVGAAFLLSLTSAALAAPGDWPQFRGPNRDGASAETGLLQELPPGGPPLVWKATGLGVGYSTVSVVGNRIYTFGERRRVQFCHRVECRRRQEGLVGQARESRRSGLARL